MPTSDFTAKLFELEDAIITNLSSNNEEIHIEFQLKRKTLSCPHCNNLTDRIHDYRTSVIRDIPVLGKKTFLHYRKRRYHCPSCNKHFYEPFSLSGKYRRITSRLAFHSLHLLRNRYSARSSASFSGISDSSVFRFFDLVNFPRPQKLPAVLSIDEFRGNSGGQKFHAILTDAHRHALFDILPTRNQSDIIHYLLQFPNRKDVKYIISDMNQVYRDVAKDLFPNATLVIDRFHVVRYVTWALENVRKRIQKQMHPSKRKYFKRSRKLLLTHKNKLKEESLLALEVMLSQSQDLAVAYHLKELFYTFMDSENRQEAIKNLKHFMLAAQAANLKEFTPCLTMLANWSTYILNAFDCPYSNGYTEGTNNAIKVIKRNAFGYRNFENFRNRIFLALT